MSHKERNDKTKSVDMSMQQITIKILPYTRDREKNKKMSKKSITIKSRKKTLPCKFMRIYN